MVHCELMGVVVSQDFDRPIGEARSTIEEDLDSTVREAVDTLIELQATFLDVSSVKVSRIGSVLKGTKTASVCPTALSGHYLMLRLRVAYALNYVGLLNVDQTYTSSLQ